MKKYLPLIIIIAIIALIITSWTLCVCSWSKTASIGENLNISPTPSVLPTMTPTAALSQDAALLTCADAKAYYEKGEYLLANNAFQALLKAAPQSKCAVEGVALLSSLPLTISTGTPEPTATATATPSAATVVPALVAIGDIDGAWEMVQTGVKADPQVKESVPACYRFWKNANHFIINIFIPIVGFLLVIWILGIIVIRMIRGRFSFQLDLTDFAAGSYPGNDTKVDNLGKSISARAELILKRNFDSLENSDKIQICSPINPPDLPAVAPTQISSIVKFLMQLFPAKILEVSGLLEQNSQKGLGLSLKIIQKDTQHYIGQTIIWENDITIPQVTKGKGSDPEIFYLLAEVASAWVFWIYCSTLKLDLRKIFGTKNFESYKWQFLSKKSDLNDQEVEKYLNQSVLCDRGNSVALFNLGGFYYKKFMKTLPNDEKTTRLEQEKLIHQIMQCLFRVIQMCDPNELPAVQANYNLGCVFMDIDNANTVIVENNAVNKKQKELFQIPELNKKQWIYYFEKAYLGAINTKANISRNLKYTLQIPYIEMRLQQNNTDVVAELQKIEASKEKDVNSVFNLACMYSRLSVPNQQIPDVIQKLINFKAKAKSQIQPEIIKEFQEKSGCYLEEAFRLDSSLAVNLKSSIIDPCFNNANLRMYQDLVEKYSK